MSAVLGYWNIRGLGQSIRLLLEYTETDYTEKRYQPGPASEYCNSNWTDVKYTLGMELPNLPYYFDGPHKITQSNAILRYIARKNGLAGTTEEEIIRVDMLENQAVDLRIAFTKLIYLDIVNFEANKAVYLKMTLPATLKHLNDYLGNKKWFAGDNITHPDFCFYEFLDVQRILSPDCLYNFENLKNFMDRFEALESIKKYMNSSRFIKYPLTGPRTAFGGNKSLSKNPPNHFQDIVWEAENFVRKP